MTNRAPAPPSGSRPEFRNINAFKDLPSYRLPPAGWVSILHRISGVLMFLLLPLVVWLFDKSVSSAAAFAEFESVFAVGMWGLPGVVWKVVMLALIWAFVHHLIAGLRHLWMDVSHATDKQFGRTSALFTLGLGSLVTVLLAFKLFGVY